MGQMATLLTERAQGSLPSTLEVNPRREGKEHCKVITLRSGREIAAPGPPSVIVKEPKQSDQSESESDTSQKDRDQPQLNSFAGKHPEVEKVDQPVSRDLALLIPYPQRLKKGKLEKEVAKFLDIFKKLHINIPFMDALVNMLSYVKFMKKVLANKKKFGEYETIAVTP